MAEYKQKKLDKIIKELKQRNIEFTDGITLDEFIHEIEKQEEKFENLVWYARSKPRADKQYWS